MIYDNNIKNNMIIINYKRITLKIEPVLLRVNIFLCILAGIFNNLRAFENSLITINKWVPT